MGSSPYTHGHPYTQLHGSPYTRLHAPLVWIDLEMTGLNPHEHTILEIAVICTDGKLRNIVEGPSLVVHHSEEGLSSMNQWSQQHHAASGLTDRSRSSDISMEQAELRVLEFVERYCIRGKAQLAGNCVFKDAEFLAAYMPQLADFFSHRVVDVSSISELARRWFPKEFFCVPKKAKKHRALDDIRESIKELQYFRTAVFKPPPPQKHAQLLA